MSIFAVLGENNVVVNRIISDTAEYIYLTLGADLLLVQEDETTGPATIGEKYLESGVFQPPRPYPSWEWNDTLIEWQPPMACPTDEKRYVWDEESLNWVEFVPPAVEEQV